MTGIAAPEEVCFDLSRSIDLHLESMATSKERAVGGVTSGLIGAGEEVSWDARHFGIWWRMTSRISAFEPPHRFVAEMVRGPFTLHRHEHRFQRCGAGTEMTDVVEVRMGRGPVRPVASTLAAAHLRRLVTARNQTTGRRAEAV